MRAISSCLLVACWACGSSQGPPAASAAATSTSGPVVVGVYWELEGAEEGDFFRLGLAVRTPEGVARHELGQHAAAHDDGPNGPEACEPPTTTPEVTTLSCVHGPSVTTFRAAVQGDQMVVTRQYAVEDEIQPPEELAHWPIPANAVLEAMATPR